MQRGEGSYRLALPPQRGPLTSGELPIYLPVAGRQLVPEGAEAEAQMPNPHMQPSLLAGIGASGRIVMKTKKGEKRKSRDTQSPWRTMTNRRPRIESLHTDPGTRLPGFKVSGVTVSLP